MRDIAAACLLLWCLFCSTAEVKSQDFLHAQGQKIVDGSGEEVILRGIGLGGWMLQEGYMLRTGGPQYKIEAKIEELVGREKKQAFYEAWLANNTRRIDIDSLASWGFNSVRLPMHYQLFTPPVEEEPVAGENTWRETGFVLTDSLLAWAAANEMYLILDLHAAPGGQGKNADINDYNPDKPSLWESEANQDKTVALWRELATRYADNPWIGGYDVINEPNWGFRDIENDPNGCSEAQNKPLWSLQQRITEAIREVDSNHIVIIEGNCWGNNYKELPPLWDDNMVISFHKYWNYNTQASIQWVLDMREERNVPVWLGETGENSNTWFTNAISLVESNGIGWAWWPLKKLGSNNPLEVRINPGYQRLIDYWRGEGEKPTPREAFAALMQLTENVKLENNRYHRGVVDAMIRQPHTREVLPFKDLTLSSTSSTKVLAVNYDLGRNGFAYSDADTGNYRVSTGGDGQPWNRGRVYRNDGVDIERDPEEGYYVNWTESGEWLQYTLKVEEEGMYTIEIVSAAAEDGGSVFLELDGESVAEQLSLPGTGGSEAWQTTAVTNVSLNSGKNRLRLLVEEGGFNLKALIFSRQSN